MTTLITAPSTARLSSIWTVTSSFMPFVVYRIVLGVVVMVLLGTNVITA